MLESNHDRHMLLAGPYAACLKRRVAGEQGHLSNAQAAELLAGLLAAEPACRVMLAHLSETNNRPELAYREAAAVLQSLGREPAEQLAVAAPAETSAVWRL